MATIAQNKVIKGAFQNYKVTNFLRWPLTLVEPGAFNLKPHVVKLTADMIKSYEIIVESTGKSAGSAISRGAAGAVLFGPIGMLAALSAKSTGTLVAIHFNDGTSSLLDIDNSFVKALAEITFSG